MAPDIDKWLVVRRRPLALRAQERLATLVKPDLSILHNALKQARSLDEARDIHASATESGKASIYNITNSIIDMYARIGSMVDARAVFESMNRRQVSWNVLIIGYARNRQGEEALRLFARMQRDGFIPDSRTFTGVILACSSLAKDEDGVESVDGKLVKTEALEKGRAVHSAMFKTGNFCERCANLLVTMYGKCGSLIDAKTMFDRMPQHSPVSWSALMKAYVENGEPEMTVELLEAMKLEECQPDFPTFLPLLKACRSLSSKEDSRQVDARAVKIKSLERGMAIHAEAVECGCDSVRKVANSLIDMYSKCGSMVDARRVFDRQHHWDVVSWNILMSGYVDNGEPELALKLFSHMKLFDCEPDTTSFVAALKACGLAASLETCKVVHWDICRSGLEHNLQLGNSLIDAYGKCGSLADAEIVFSCLPQRDVVTWTTLIAGYSCQGDTERVLHLFQSMEDEGLMPNAVTFLCVLTACKHAGLVDKGGQYLGEMQSKYGISPGIEHYTCIVDLLSRANQLEAAVSVAKSMPMKPDDITWRTILSASRKWKDSEVGRVAFEALVEMDERDVTAYMLMANIYGSKAMWEEYASVEAMRNKAQAWKKAEPGKSWWTGEDGVVHTFVAGDKSHPQTVEIQKRLKQILLQLKENTGYVADLETNVARNISDAEKLDTLCGHSEKLALVCALINTASGSRIRIMKNLRICEDCHKVMALVSKLERRSILCRDASRFHIYVDGKCSCGDYW